MAAEVQTGVYTLLEIKKFSMLFPSTLKELNRFQIGEFEMDLAEELVYGNIKKC